MDNPLSKEEDVSGPPGAKVVSALLRSDGKMEVIKRLASNASYLSHPPKPVPDVVYKEIYSAGADGKIILERTIRGTHTPARQVREQISFPDDTPVSDPQRAAVI
jgi:hypothetical protein